MAAAGEARLSRMTGAVHTRAPPAAARLIIVCRSIPSTLSMLTTAIGTTSPKLEPPHESDPDALN
jgi:hypothetical protein